MTDRAGEVYTKSRRQIMIDNFIGGLTWGLGSVIGATIVVGILGLIIVNTKHIPLIGDVVKVAVEQINNGINELKQK